MYTMNYTQVINLLRSNSSEKNIGNMKRVNIPTSNALGISIYTLRTYAKEIGKNHKLALQLWNSDIHEARLLACLIDDPLFVSEEQMEQWVISFNSWDICDQCCSNLFDKTSFAIKKAIEWSQREEEFVKRAGFVLMACLSVHNKNMNNDEFSPFFDCIIRESNDKRNFVKKSVNWALRQIGKRNARLNQKAVEVAETILQNDLNTTKWIAKNALVELTSDKIQKRIGN